MDLNEDVIHNHEDDEDTFIYIGRFDPAGFPIVTSRQFHYHASVTLQAISLVSLIEQTLQPEPLHKILIRHEDGSVICVEPHVDGYIAYLKPELSSERPTRLAHRIEQAD
jgi:hypothetical protein